QRHAEEIGEAAAGRGPLDHAEDAAVGGVHAPAPTRPLPVVRVASAEGGALQHLPLVEAHAIDHAHFIAVLKIAPDPRQVNTDGEAGVRALRARTDAREHEELRRVDGAPGQDRLPRGAHLATLARSLRGTAMGVVEPLPAQVLDADGAMPLVEEDARGKRV